MDSAGLTLLELTIAIALLAVVAVLAHGGLIQTLRTYEQSASSVEQVTGLQRGLVIMGRDIEALAPRPITDIDGTRVPAFIAGPVFLELTRDGFSSPLGGIRSTLQRVRYHYSEGVLHRSHWEVLDRTSNTTSVDERTVLDGLTELSFHYLHEDGRWLTQWPGTTQVSPKAIEVRFAAPGIGQIRRLWQVH